jgi:hypothetical protein
MSERTDVARLYAIVAPHAALSKGEAQKEISHVSYYIREIYEMMKLSTGAIPYKKHKKRLIAIRDAAESLKSLISDDFEFGYLFEGHPCGADAAEVLESQLIGLMHQANILLKDSNQFDMIRAVGGALPRNVKSWEAEYIWKPALGLWTKVTGDVPPISTQGCFVAFVSELHLIAGAPPLTKTGGLRDAVKRFADARKVNRSKIGSLTT